jgi:hypothetical protein
MHVVGFKQRAVRERLESAGTDAKNCAGATGPALSALLVMTPSPEAGDAI